ncbi:hypothetical protein MMC22_010181 [Lobaria immixta]|nr:hypothetical protein [Lobaria immixta]
MSWDNTAGTTHFALSFHIKLGLNSSTGGASGEWDAGNSGAADNWDTGNSGAADNWDTGNAGAASGTGGNDASTKGNNPTQESGDGFNNRTPGEEGHSKVFKGICRICEKEGHPAAQCPDKPPMMCRNCKKEGHAAKDCKENRVMDLSDIPDEQPEIAWQQVIAADQEKDLDDLRKALKIYCKAVPESTWVQLERAFRLHHFNTFLVAREKEMLVTQTLVNLQGKLDCKYEVGFFFSDKPRRAILAQGWPSSPEENLNRLEDAGTPMDRGVPKCQRCSELGHVARECKEEEQDRERTEVKCQVIGLAIARSHGRIDLLAETARSRDTRPRSAPSHALQRALSARNAQRLAILPRTVQRAAVKSAETAGSNAGSYSLVSSLTLNREEGHKAVDCDKPKDPARTTCRNCDTVGHTVRRCPQPDPDAVDGNAGGQESGFGGDTAADVAPEGDWANGAGAGASNDWERANPAAAPADAW